MTLGRYCTDSCSVNNYRAIVYIPTLNKKMKIIFVDISFFGSKVIFFIIIFRLYKCYIWLYRCYTSYTGKNGEKNPKLYQLV